MKLYKCPICHRERKISDDEQLVMILCPGCLEEMRELKDWGKNDRNTKARK
jgi:hypothetical protein